MQTRYSSTGYVHNHSSYKKHPHFAPLFIQTIEASFTQLGFDVCTQHLDRVITDHIVAKMQDVGQSILESYSRVLESLAHNIIARIDDVLYANDLVKRSLGPQPSMAREDRSLSRRLSFSGRRTRHNGSTRFTALSTAYATPSISPSCSPTMSPRPTTPTSPLEGVKAPILTPGLGKALSDYMCRHIPEGGSLLELEVPQKFSLDGGRPWTYAGHLENSHALHSPPGRD